MKKYVQASVSDILKYQYFFLFIRIPRKPNEEVVTEVEEKGEKKLEEGDIARRMGGATITGWKRCTICLESTGCKHALCTNHETKVFRIWKIPVEKVENSRQQTGESAEEDLKDESKVEASGKYEKETDGEAEDSEEKANDKAENVEEEFEVSRNLNLQFQHRKKPLLSLRVNCSVCQKNFASQKSLTKHNDANHKAKKCKVCGILFENSITAREHVRNKHSWEGRRKPVNSPVPCKLCEKSYQTKGGLRKHMRKHHTKSFSPDVSSSKQKALSLECETCGRHYKSRDGMRKHKKTHTRGTALAQPQQQDGVVLEQDTSSTKQKINKIMESLSHASKEEQDEILGKIGIVRRSGKKRNNSNSLGPDSDAGLYSDGD